MILENNYSEKIEAVNQDSSDYVERKYVKTIDYNKVLYMFNIDASLKSIDIILDRINVLQGEDLEIDVVNDLYFDSLVEFDDTLYGGSNLCSFMQLLNNMIACPPMIKREVITIDSIFDENIKIFATFDEAQNDIKQKLIYLTTELNTININNCSYIDKCKMDVIKYMIAVLNKILSTFIKLRSMEKSSTTLIS